MKNPFHALNTFSATLIERADTWLVRVDTGRRPTSGVVYAVDAERALVVTAAHTLPSREGLSVARGKGAGTPATLLGYDPRTDLALLSTAPEGLTAAPFADSDTARVGHMVLTLGRPGAAVRATLGLVSAVGDAWQTGFGGDVARFFDIDGRLPEGFSGGALLDVDGRVLGVNTHALVRGGTTLPTETVRRVCDAIAVKGHVPQGHLGLGTQPAHLPPDAAEIAGQKGGLVVIHVEPEGPAARAGLGLGDVLLGLDGRAVEHHTALIAARDFAAGRTVTARVLRAGEVREVPFEVGERAPDPPGGGHGRCCGGRRGGFCR